MEWHQADPEGREYLGDRNTLTLLFAACFVPKKTTTTTPKSQLNFPHREMLNPTGKGDILDQSQSLQMTIKCPHQRLDVGAFHAREVAALAMGWGWSQVGKENVPGGVQLLKDPPVDEQVLLSLGEKERKRP